MKDKEPQTNVIEYKLECRVVVTAANNFEITVTILQAVDGETFSEAAMFRQEVKPGIADSVVLEHIRSRFEEYCKADSDRIAKDDLDARATAIQTAMDGIRFTP